MKKADLSKILRNLIVKEIKSSSFVQNLIKEEVEKLFYKTMTENLVKVGQPLRESIQVPTTKQQNVQMTKKKNVNNNFLIEERRKSMIQSLGAAGTPMEDIINDLDGQTVGTSSGPSAFSGMIADSDDEGVDLNKFGF